MTKWICFANVFAATLQPWWSGFLALVFGSKCLGWNPLTHCRVSLLALECRDKKSERACVGVLVGGEFLGTVSLLSGRPEATGDLWPEDSWSVAGEVFWARRHGWTVTQVRGCVTIGGTIGRGSCRRWWRFGLIKGLQENRGGRRWECAWQTSWSHTRYCSGLKLQS